MNAKISKQPDKPSKDTVYVDVDDEITGIIDKVEAAKSNIVALVLPKRATTLQSIVNMRLLKRSADHAGKSVVLITSEAAILPLAGAARLHTAKNLQSQPSIPVSPVDEPDSKDEEESVTDEEEAKDTEEEPAEKIDYNKPVGALAVATADEDEAIDLDDEDEQKPKEKADKKSVKPAKDKKLKVPNFERFRLLIVLGAVVFVGLIVFLIFAIFVLPKAKITVKTTSIPVSADMKLNTSSTAKTLDTANSVIPAVLKTTDEKSTQSVTATGQQNNGTKATGTVTMSAGSCSGTVPSDIPAGVGVSTAGLTFITQEKTSFTPVVSGGKCSFQSAGTTDITAQVSGAKYNVNNATFSVAGYSGVQASGDASGGTDNIITIVSQSDLDNARSKITSAEADKFGKTFQDQLAKEGNYVLVSTFKPSDPVVTSTPDIGQPASNVSVNIKITYTVLVVSKADLTKAINDALDKQIDKKKQKLSTDDVLKDATVTVENQTSPTAVTLNISEDTTAVPIIDIDGIKNQVKGQKTSTIKSAITTIPGVKEVDVKLSPFWVSKAPKKTTKITVVQEQIKN